MKEERCYYIIKHVSLNRTLIKRNNLGARLVVRDTFYLQMLNVTGSVDKIIFDLSFRRLATYYCSFEFATKSLANCDNLRLMHLRVSKSQRFLSDYYFHYFFFCQLKLEMILTDYDNTYVYLVQATRHFFQHDLLTENCFRYLNCSITWLIY